MIKSPLKAIRANCIDCCGGSSAEVKLCECTNCPLHSFRFGKNPHAKKRSLTDEQRQASAIRLAKARATKKRIDE
jgi:hypothetical protein